MTVSLIGWITIGLLALTWELLGLFNVFGIWPLTWDVRDGLQHHQDYVSLVLLLSIVGFPAWLVYHFFAQKRTYGK